MGGSADEAEVLAGEAPAMLRSPPRLERFCSDGEHSCSSSSAPVTLAALAAFEHRLCVRFEHLEGLLQAMPMHIEDAVKAPHNGSDLSLPLSSAGTLSRKAGEHYSGRRSTIIRSSAVSFAEDTSDELEQSRASMVKTLGSAPNVWSSVGVNSLEKALTIDFSEQEERRPRCVLHPDGRCRTAMDILTLAAMLYDAFAVPFDMAWRPEWSVVLFVGAMATAIVWTLDMLVNLNSGYYEDGILEMSRRRIVRRYLFTWGLVDLTINAVDWFSICSVFWEEQWRGVGDGGMTLLRLLKVHRVVRLAALARSQRLMERTRRLQALGLFRGRDRVMMQVGKLAVLILWINHILCCAWFAIGTAPSSDTGLTWLDPSHSSTIDYREVGTLFQYTTALHWAMTQMTPGSMEVVPKNSLERVLSVVSIMFGLLFGSSIISQLSAMMVKMQIQQQEKSAKVLNLRKFLSQQQISPSFAHQVERVLLDRLSVSHRLREQDVEALELLPAHVQAQIKECMFVSHLVRHQLLRQLPACSPTFMRALCSKVFSTYLARGDELLPPSEECKTVRIIRRGEAVYQCVGKDTSSVGEGTWIGEPCLWMQWTTVGRVETTSACELVSLPREALSEAVAKNRVLGVVRMYGSAFRCMVANMLEEDLSDIGFMDMGEAMFYLTGDMRVRYSARVRRAAGGPWSGGGLLPQRFLWKDMPREAKEDIEQGLSTLWFDADGALVEIVNEAEVLVRDPGSGCVLAEIGTVRQGRMALRCRLPHACVIADSSIQNHQQLAERTLHEDLAGFTTAKAVHFKEKVVILEREGGWPHRHSWPRRCFRTTFEADLESCGACFGCGRELGSQAYSPAELLNSPANIKPVGSERKRPSFSTAQLIGNAASSSIAAGKWPFFPGSSAQEVGFGGARFDGNMYFVPQSPSQCVAHRLLEERGSDRMGPIASGGVCAEISGTLYAWLEPHDFDRLESGGEDIDAELAAWFSAVDLSSRVMLPERPHFGSCPMGDEAGGVCRHLMTEMPAVHPSDSEGEDVHYCV